VYNIAGKVRNEYFESPQDYSNSARYHRSILEALKKRDQGAARMAMTDHMIWVKKVFLG
jgi:DNA-binding GntR family transcriptional regulator